MRWRPVRRPARGRRRQPRRAAAMQRAVLDAATVDRLADDVIRRVERRVRIERERRGL